MERTSGLQRSGPQHHIVHPTEGWVYCANSRGLFRSKDGGESFEKIQSGSILGMDTILTEPDNIYIIKQNGLYISTDCGDSFDRVKSSGFPTFNPNFIRVSPADPNRMLVQDNHLDKAGSYADASACYYSHDGGMTWEKVDKIVGGTYRKPAGTWIPYCARQNPFAWHPTDPDIALTVGGDFVMRSTDGGKTWTSLTRYVGDGREGPDGGREATTIRVNAATREVFVGTCCRGMWKMAAPQEN